MINNCTKTKFSLDLLHVNLNVLFLINAPKSDLICFERYVKYFIAIIITYCYNCHFIYANRKNVLTQLLVIFSIIYITLVPGYTVLILNSI